MKISRISEVPKIPFINSLFTSEDVTSQAVLSDSDEYEMRVVNFGRGVRLKFHSHSQEQILIVTSGKGIVATDDEERVVFPGDIIFFPKNEKHWHGATADSEFSHIFIYRKGTEYKQLED